ncbi:MAG: hypothetical protein NW220_07015 [Leptolyngbyaceae cyanobacterium bins.349]|nr:hypothetical protein [Leptolyngbyaceae cyanobacterium bins.349]
MRQLLRLLLLTPTVLSPMYSLSLVVPAHANPETWVNVTQSYSCKRTLTREPKQLVCRRLNAGSTAPEQIVDLTKAQTATAIAEVDAEVDAAPGTLPLTFEFTDEESNASVSLFGCDCPVCIRSLRQLRSLMS